MIKLIYISAVCFYTIISLTACTLAGNKMLTTYKVNKQIHQCAANILVYPDLRQ